MVGTGCHQRRERYRRRLIVGSDRHALKRLGQPAAQSELAARPRRCPPANTCEVCNDYS
jgi:hypothetical protein